MRGYPMSFKRMSVFFSVMLSAILPLACPGSRAAAQVVFKDVTAEVGLTGVGNHNSAWGDYNKDGWVDLYDGLALWKNDGGKKFVKVEQPVPGMMGLWGDFNNDGRLDLYCTEGGQLYMGGEGGKFTDVSERVEKRPMGRSRGAAWLDMDGDGFLDLYVGGYASPTWQEYNTDAIYKSDGGKSFKITWKSDTILPARGVTAADFDNDGDVDIHVSNYRLCGNLLWVNDGTGKFEFGSEEYGVIGDLKEGYYGHTIGSSWGDLDNDGNLDLFIGNFSHAAAYQDRPKFYRNMGKAGKYHFEDKSAGAGMARQESFASPTLGDFDNDGDLDIYFTTVYGGDHSVLYRNEGDWKFKDVTSEEGLGGMPPTYQGAWADFDNDGDLDLVTGGRLYRNNGNSSHWLKVSLEGAGNVNRAAIGAQVRINVGGSVLMRQVESSTGEANQNDLTLHFGLGENAGPVKLLITWPGGKKQEVTTKVDRTVSVKMKAPADSSAAE